MARGGYELVAVPGTNTQFQQDQIYRRATQQVQGFGGRGTFAYHLKIRFRPQQMTEAFPEESVIVEQCQPCSLFRAGPTRLATYRHVEYGTVKRPLRQGLRRKDTHVCPEDYRRNLTIAGRCRFWIQDRWPHLPAPYTVKTVTVRRFFRVMRRASLLAGLLATAAWAQKPLTWQQVRDQFEATNPTLRAGRVGVDEARAQEITAFLRPNPTMTATLDQIAPFNGNPYRPLGFALPFLSASYLHERDGKRELRLESAQKGTAVVTSQLADQERTLLFNLRNAFVQTLQQKAVLALANENLAYYDRLLGVSSDRFKAGDIAQVDLDRLELQRVQFETDLQSALVNLRTAKIQLLTLLDDRTGIEQFDVTGPFEFTEQMLTIEELHRIALANRPDLKAAMQAVEKARTDHRLAEANGSSDPVFGMDVARNPPIPAYFGFSVTIPLRIFDRNQGEKARTQLDIQRNQRLQDATQALVFSDADSAFATLNGTRVLLRAYQSKYLAQATRVRETVSFAYQHGGASLLDFLNAQNDYRSVQLNYLNLVGAYMTAASQLDMAAGTEVIQ